MEEISKLIDKQEKQAVLYGEDPQKRRRSLQRCAMTMPSGARACCAVGPHRQSRGVALTAPSPDLEII